MGSGGARFGAGRPAMHVKAEHCKQLDVRRWHREGVLRAGSFGSWTWSNSSTGERVGSIGYSVGDGYVNLNYSINDKPSNQRITLARTHCNFGGARPWFVCPVRGERAAVLFLRAGRFACRQCQRIAYASQSDDSLKRDWRKQSRLESKLDAGWARPKGMHHATRERLVSAIIDSERRRDDALASFVGMMMRKHPALRDDLKRWGA